MQLRKSAILIAMLSLSAAPVFAQSAGVAGSTAAGAEIGSPNRAMGQDRADQRKSDRAKGSAAARGRAAGDTHIGASGTNEPDPNAGVKAEGSGGAVIGPDRARSATGATSGSASGSTGPATSGGIGASTGIGAGVGVGGLGVGVGVDAGARTSTD